MIHDDFAYFCDVAKLSFFRSYLFEIVLINSLKIFSEPGLLRYLKEVE